ncbi:MAG: PAS domain S-box protein [Syntrophaceae bacterium]|nr:PAS domain S-box protein [Syntrophaceae bacterium]
MKKKSDKVRKNKKLSKKSDDMSKRAKESHRQNAERYRTFIENINDGCFEVDLAGNFTFFNDSLCRMTGCSKDELIGANYSKFSDKESSEKVFKAFNQIFKTGEPIKEFDWQIIRKDSTKRYIEASVSLQKDLSGKPTGFRGIIRDITERKQVEEKYKNIFENAQEGIYQSTPEGKFIMANQSMARILGYDSPGDLITRITDITHQLYVDPEERKKLLQMIEQQGFARNREVQFYRKDGRIIWVSRTMRAVRNEKGQVLYYEGIIEDITERKESVARLRNALGGTVRAIASIVETRDPYTAGHQRNVANLARAIAGEMGLSKDQIEGIRVAGIIHDIGKISVPAELLSKSRKLTNIELNIIKAHAQSGYDILNDIEFPWPIARMVIEHHERIDGSGYPQKLRGEEISLEARILAVADVVDAIASHRPYRPTLGINFALDEIFKNRGILYDANVVDACLKLFQTKKFTLN